MANRVILWATGLVTLFYFVWPAPLIAGAQAAAASLFPG